MYIARPAVEVYKSEEYVWPRKDVNPELKKKPDYAIACAKAIYSLGVRGRSGVAQNRYNKFNELRLYAEGRQSEAIYQPYFAGQAQSPDGTLITGTDGDWTNSQEAERKGLNNIKYDIISLMPKIVTRIKGMFAQYDYDISADNIDADSGAEKETKKWEAYAQAQLEQFINSYKVMAGIPIDQQVFVPESIEELEAYEAAGGFKLKDASVLEKLIKHTYNISDWDEIKDKLLSDVVALNVIGTRDYYDPETCKFMTRYLDPANTYIQYSKYWNFKDSEYAAEIVPWTISKLRAKGLSEEVLAGIAKQYCGYMDNPAESSWNSVNTQYTNGAYGYDQFIIPVLESCWVDVDDMYEKVVINSHGYRQVMPQAYGKIKKNDKTDTRITKIRKLYQASWVINTDYVFDYGPYPNQIRPEPHTVVLPFHLYMLPGKSITEMLVPVLDQIQIAWLKLQNSLSVVFEEGYMIDWSMLQNIQIGGNTMTPIQLIEMLRTNGVLPFMPNMLGGSYAGGAVTPIHKLPGGLGTRLQEAISSFTFYIQMIEQLTGLSPVSLGATPGADAPVSTTEASLSATQDILRPLIRAVFKIKEDVANNASLCIPNIIRVDERAKKMYEKVVGETDIRVLLEATERPAQYGIKLTAKPTQVEKQRLLDAAVTSLQQGRDGKPGINYSQYAYVEDQILNGGNLKEMRMQLGYMIKKAEEKMAQQQTDIVDRQGQWNANNETIKQQGEKIKEDLRIRGDMMIEAEKGHWNERLEYIKQGKDPDAAKREQQQMNMVQPLQGEPTGKPAQPAQTPMS